MEQSEKQVGLSQRNGYPSPMKTRQAEVLVCRGGTQQGGLWDFGSGVPRSWGRVEGDIS